MSQCIVINISDRGDWRDQVFGVRKWAVGLHIPADTRPSLIHPTREDAEKEAARLACEHQGEFAVFELQAIVEAKVLADTDRVRGIGPCAAMVPRWTAERPEI